MTRIRIGISTRKRHCQATAFLRPRPRLHRHDQVAAVPRARSSVPLLSEAAFGTHWLSTRTGIQVQRTCCSPLGSAIPPAVLCALTLALVAAALASAASTAPGEPSRETDDVRAETSDCFWGCGSAAGGAEQSTVRGAQAQQLRTVGRNGLQAETYSRKKEHLGEAMNASLKNDSTEMGKTPFLSFQHRS